MANAVAVPEHPQHHDEQPTGIQRAMSGPERLSSFLRDVRQEMRKVITPTRAEVQATTIVVIVTVFLFAAYFELVDLILGRAIDKVFTLFLKH